MKKFGSIVLAVILCLGLFAVVQAGQTILRAFAPAGSDGTQIILQIDWEQVQKAAPEVTQVWLRRRAVGPPEKMDSLAYVPAGTARYTDTGLDPDRQYHYFAYFKDADGSTQRFGSSAAVVHLGPIAPLPGK